MDDRARAYCITSPKRDLKGKWNGRRGAAWANTRCITARLVSNLCNGGRGPFIPDFMKHIRDVDVITMSASSLPCEAADITSNVLTVTEPYPRADLHYGRYPLHYIYFRS